ncbi:efflux RND transporter periplasmic adaptor subunit [Mucilaginibacter sp. OK283]|uniref:efflux RND transporter periplasmic adaptor subunit n=1 Tax=Mucilaginibacter sp. OK283 TaxID=1881049 RepID=UPI000B859615|nr:efflux RND transporter periplasmic adaptor subunit [Mucilaginibacter sp. OK283]
MKKSYKKILITLSVIVIAGLVWFVAFKKKEQPIVLPTEKPTYGYISQSVTATGTIQPLDTVSVGTQVSGTISAVNADFNSRVKKGQLLAQLDKTLLQAVVDQNRANLQTQRSQLIFNQSNFARQKLLYSTGSISKLDYETSLNTYNAAVAGVANAEAQLRSSTKNLSYADIYSPIDGVVLSRNISIGQTVAASFSTPTLFVLAKDITKMQVQAAIDEADIGNVAKGQRASFTVDAYIEDSFKGTVAEVRLHPKVSSNVVTYTTIINAPNDDMKLKPGMTANITVYTKEQNNALLISSKALNFTPDSIINKQFVLQPVKAKAETKEAGSNVGKAGSVWIKKGNILVQTLVIIGLDDNTHAEILKGLNTSDEVVSSLPVPGGVVAESSSILPAPPGAKKKQ